MGLLSILSRRKPPKLPSEIARFHMASDGLSGVSDRLFIDLMVTELDRRKHRMPINDLRDVSRMFDREADRQERLRPAPMNHASDAVHYLPKGVYHADN